MRALQVRDLLPDHGGAGLADLAVPVPGPGEVRVRVRAAAVNFPVGTLLRPKAAKHDPARGES